jgi:glycine C-acetyltransferase
MRYEEELEGLKRASLYRELRRVRATNPFVYINNKRYLMLSSNDYLGLSRDVRVINAMKNALEQVSQCSSRLIAGNDPLLEELEEKIEEHKSFEKVLLYPTGYMANLAIDALIDDGIIISDELNHASIIDACRLARAKVRVFKHNDLSDLEQKLEGGNKMIVTEGVFSMDGDFSKLKEISDIAKEHDAMLVLDDAHGDFIYGRNFRGVQEEFDADVDIVISSLSKGLGCFGGYIASRREIIEYLINRSRAFIYTSALPAHIAAASIEALEIVKKGERQRDLLKVSKMVREGLLDLGFDVIGESHIIPIIIGDEKKALRLAEELLEEGIFVQAIRYPTVKKGDARLRLSLTALHLEYIDDIIAIFKRLKNRA